MDCNKNKRGKSYILYAVPAVIIFTILFFIRGVPFEDDIYILYRYADNWASGYGPVFNIGEYVEGYSTFLWTAIVTIGVFFSLDPVQLAPLLNLFIGIMCLFLISRISGFIQFSRPRLMAFVLPLFCAFSYGFYYYAASGMDTIIFSLVLLLCIISLYKRKNSGNYLITLPFLVLLNLVRAEGFVYSIVLLAVLTYFVFREHKNIPKQLFVTIFVFAGLTMLLFVLRYSYYREWIPATVMAKGYGTYLFKTALLNGDYEALKEFLRVILSGLRYEAFLFFLGAWIPFVVLVWNRNKNNVLLWLIAFSIAVNVFVSVWAGGDYFPHKRHFIAVLPVAIIFIARAMDLLLCRYRGSSFYKKAGLSIAVALILLMWAGYFIKPTLFTKVYDENGRSLYIRQIGTLLHDMPVSTTLMSQMLGKISYYAGSHVYIRDILGLTDIHNAKYGDEWGFNWGRGACGRTDFTYSFTTPFDMFFYNSKNMHNKFISFCQKNPSLCEKYRFFKKEEWIRSESFVIANINHPVSTALEEKFGAVAIPIDENLKNIIRVN